MEKRMSETIYIYKSSVLVARVFRENVVYLLYIIFRERALKASVVLDKHCAIDALQKKIKTS